MVYNHECYALSCVLWVSIFYLHRRDSNTHVVIRHQKAVKISEKSINRKEWKTPKAQKQTKKRLHLLGNAKKSNGNTNEPNAENSAAATQQLSNEQQAFPAKWPHWLLFRSLTLEIRKPHAAHQMARARQACPELSVIQPAAVSFATQILNKPQCRRGQRFKEPNVAHWSNIAQNWEHVPPPVIDGLGKLGKQLTNNQLCDGSRLTLDFSQDLLYNICIETKFKCRGGFTYVAWSCRDCEKG